MILLVGQVALGPGGARGVPGDRLPADVRAAGEVGRADRPRRPHPRVRRARVHDCAARAGPGPVVLALPEDMLAAASDAADAPPFHGRAAQPGAARHRRAARRCSTAAERPLAIIGGGGWTPRRRDDLRAFLEANALPAGAAFRRQDALDNDSPSYAGDVGIGINPALAARVREADLLLVVGPRLGEMTTSGYTLLDVAAAAADARPRPSRRRGARPRLPGRAADPVRAWSSSPPRSATCAVEPRWREWTARGARRLRGWQQPRADARRGRPRRVHRAPARAPARRDRHNGAGNLHRWVAPLLALPRLSDASSRRQRRDGLRRPGRGRREGRRAPSARSSASPATATS